MRAICVLTIVMLVGVVLTVCVSSDAYTEEAEPLESEYLGEIGGRSLYRMNVSPEPIYYLVSENDGHKTYRIVSICEMNANIYCR